MKALAFTRDGARVVLQVRRPCSWCLLPEADCIHCGGTGTQGTDHYIDEVEARRLLAELQAALEGR